MKQFDSVIKKINKNCLAQQARDLDMLYHAKVEVIKDQFDREIAKLESQFSDMRLQLLRKDQTLIKFMQIAYDQEMYIDEIRRIVNTDLAKEIIKHNPPVQIGNIISQTSNEEYKIKDRFEKAKHDLAGNVNLETVHDKTKIEKRISYQMKLESEVPDLGSNLDSNFISKTLKNIKLQENNHFLSKGEKVKQLEKHITLMTKEYDTLRKLYLDNILMLDKYTLIINEQREKLDNYGDIAREKEMFEQGIDAQVNKRVTDIKMKIKSKYSKYLSEQKKELDLSSKINERLNDYVERIKKELVIAKLIIKNPRMLKDANQLMNFDLYQLGSPKKLKNKQQIKKLMNYNTPTKEINTSLSRHEGDSHKLSLINTVRSPFSSYISRDTFKLPIKNFSRLPAANSFRMNVSYTNE